MFLHSINLALIVFSLFQPKATWERKKSTSVREGKFKSCSGAHTKKTKRNIVLKVASVYAWFHYHWSFIISHHAWYFSYRYF